MVVLVVLYYIAAVYFCRIDDAFLQFLLEICKCKPIYSNFGISIFNLDWFYVNYQHAPIKCLFAGEHVGVVPKGYLYFTAITFFIGGQFKYEMKKAKIYSIKKALTDFCLTKLTII
jgi:hypothetical protein